MTVKMRKVTLKIRNFVIEMWVLKESRRTAARQQGVLGLW